MKSVVYCVYDLTVVSGLAYVSSLLITTRGDYHFINLQRLGFSKQFRIKTHLGWIKVVETPLIYNLYQSPTVISTAIFLM